jgi:hypothetical protein
MTFRTLLLALTLTAAAAGGAYDVVAPAGPATAARVPELDGSRVLRWDNGSPNSFIAWHTGGGAWVGNDFDISTLASYNRVKRIWLYSTPAWPNSRWDGWRLGIFAFAGGVPGSLIWGPKFDRGTTGGYGWNYGDVYWVLPGGVLSFVAAMNQYYNYPNCDPFAVDDNATFRGHSWVYYDGDWTFLSTNADPYRNLMLRVAVDDEQNPEVAPGSWGRLKALYY